MNSQKITAALEVAFALIKSGMDIYNIVAGRTDITDAEFADILQSQDTAQAKARARLQALIDSHKE